MKKRTFDRTMTASIIVLYRKVVKDNMENPTKENWISVRNTYMKISALGMIGIISLKTQKRALKMFNECTAIL